MKLYHLKVKGLPVDIASMERVLNYYGIKYIRIEDKREWYVYTTEEKIKRMKDVYVDVEFIEIKE